jgi:hypothetical protein|tara:strand:- start:454 stop:576 length:123 start_codon:yes stop_codon:yes gene_type:complete
MAIYNKKAPISLNVKPKKKSRLIWQNNHQKKQFKRCPSNG